MIYSRVIGFLKITLPLVALVLMATVFLVATPVDPSRAIELAEIDVLDRAQDPRLSGASFAGVTSDGTALRVEAETARSDPEARLRFQADNLRLSLSAPGGDWIEAHSAMGRIDRGTGGFVMSELVQITASDGTVLHAPHLEGLLDATRIEAPAGLSARGPMGEITAPQARILRDTQGGGGFVVVFTGGVRLLYTPQNDANPDVTE
jgi:lipopolysaccharide export system protein LptC